MLNPFCENASVTKLIMESKKLAEKWRADDLQKPSEVLHDEFRNQMKSCLSDLTIASLKENYKFLIAHNSLFDHQTPDVHCLQEH